MRTFFFLSRGCQNSLGGIILCIILLSAYTNRLPDLQIIVSFIKTKAATLKKKSYLFVPENLFSSRIKEN